MAVPFNDPVYGNMPTDSEPSGITLKKIANSAKTLADNAITPPPSGSDFLEVNGSSALITGPSPITPALFKSGNNIGSVVNCVFEGDSLTDDNGSTGATGCWPYKLQTLISPFQQINYYNIAENGNHVADVISDYATEAQPLSPAVTGVPGYYFLWIGTNDIADGTSAASVFSSLQTAWAQARADGYKVIAFTITDRTDNTGAENTQLAALNVLIRAAGANYDVLVDVAFFIGAVGTTSDGIHFTEANNARIAGYTWACFSGSGPSMIECSFRGFSNNVLINSATPTTIAFGSESYDTRFSFATGTGIFIVPVTGIYDFSAFLVGTLTLTATQFFALSLGVAGSEVAKMNFTSGIVAAALSTGFNGVASVALTKGDSVTLLGYTTGSFTPNTGSANSWFAGSLRRVS